MLPNSMSGLTGSSGRCDTAPHAVDGPKTLAAAAVPPNASAQDMNSRLLKPRSVTLSDMAASFAFPDPVSANPQMLCGTEDVVHSAV